MTKYQETRIRAMAEYLHNLGQQYGWAGPHFKKTFQEFEATDPIGFEEWLDCMALAWERGNAAVIALYEQEQSQPAAFAKPEPPQD